MLHAIDPNCVTWRWQIRDVARVGNIDTSMLHTRATLSGQHWNRHSFLFKCFLFKKSLTAPIRHSAPNRCLPAIIRAYHNKHCWRAFQGINIDDLEQSFLMFLWFLAAAHISRLTCTKMARDRSRQPATEICSISRNVHFKSRNFDGLRIKNPFIRFG